MICTWFLKNQVRPTWLFKLEFSKIKCRSIEGLEHLLWTHCTVFISILVLSCIYKHCGFWVPYLILFILILILLIREMEWRLDKEGREYHHYEDFCKLYRSEILNLNRMLDMLSKNGMLPGNLNLNFSVSNVSVFHW